MNSEPQIMLYTLTGMVRNRTSVSSNSTRNRSTNGSDSSQSYVPLSVQGVTGQYSPNQGPSSKYSVLHITQGTTSCEENYLTHFFRLRFCCGNFNHV